MIALFVLFALLFLGLFFFFLRQQKPSKKNKQDISKLIQPNLQLQEKLLTLLAGDKSAMKRLIDREKQLNPGRSEDWYLEKVIWQLERDRRS